MRVPAWKPTLAAAALIGSQALVLAPVATASGGPIIVTADMPGAVPAGHMWAFNDFFPRTLRVAQGQTVGFAIAGFHTATLLPSGTSAASDLKANGIATADEDLGANPNGTSHVAIDFAALMPTSFACGGAANPCAFDGSSVVSSGAPLGGPPAGPFMVTVTAAPGTYAFLCRIHPGMSGHLTVVPSPADATTPDQAAATSAHQLSHDIKAAYRAEARATHDAHWQHGDGTSTWFVTPGVMSEDRKVAVLEFLPQNIDVHTGDRVVWRMKESNEPHTVTFPGDLGTDQLALCETAGGAADGAAFPTAFPPAGPQDFGCAPGTGPVEFEFGGGNGVTTVSTTTTQADSGFMGTRRLAHAYGLPSSAVLPRFAVDFTGATPGTYTYVCQIHDGMAGTVTVH